MHHTDSKRLPFTCKQLYDLVADIESYPAFLPGWSQARILNSNDSHLEVEQQLRAGSITLRFHSSAQLEECQRILIVSRDAPFGKLTIDWQFTPQAQDYCEIRVAISLELHAGPLNYPLSRLLAHSSDELLPLFEKRAHSLYSPA